MQNGNWKPNKFSKYFSLLPLFV